MSDNVCVEYYYYDKMKSSLTKGPSCNCCPSREKYL